MPRLLLCADIGGTNSRMQLWEASSSGEDGAAATEEALRCDQRYPTQNFEGLEALLRRFLTDAGLAVPAGEACAAGSAAAYEGDVVDACSVAICMPVEGERRICGPGGVSWALDVVPEVEEALGKVIRKCTLLNDFVAVGLGLQALDPSEVLSLTPSVFPTPRATALCLGPGTGLGTCFLTWNSAISEYDAHPGEGGAPEFAARTEEEWEFKQFLAARAGALLCLCLSRFTLTHLRLLLAGRGARCRRPRRASDRREHGLRAWHRELLPVSLRARGARGDPVGWSRG
jgi:glucokinase